MLIPISFIQDKWYPFSSFQVSFFWQILPMILHRWVGVTPDRHSNMLATSEKQSVSFPKFIWISKIESFSLLCMGTLEARGYDLWVLEWPFNHPWSNTGVSSHQGSNYEREVIFQRTIGVLYLKNISWTDDTKVINCKHLCSNLPALTWSCFSECQDCLVPWTFLH